MANYLTLISGIKTLVAAITSSAGAGDAGKIIALDGAGKIDSTFMPSGLGADSLDVEASENLSAGDFVNLWNDGGTLKARKADNSTTGKAADGYTLTAITAAATDTIYFDDSNSQLSGLTIGSEYFLGTGGGVMTTAPSSSGETIQGLGKAVSATSLVFERGEVYEIA